MLFRSNYTNQFIYHIHLSGEKEFVLETSDELEVAAFLPLHNAVINDSTFQTGEFIEFERKSGTIEIQNNGESPIDIILFGGEKYTEAIVAQGPFVMNTQQEIADAYRDFYAGKYGKNIQ